MLRRCCCCCCCTATQLQPTNRLRNATSLCLHKRSLRTPSTVWAARRRRLTLLKPCNARTSERERQRRDREREREGACAERAGEWASLRARCFFDEWSDQLCPKPVNVVNVARNRNCCSGCCSSSCCCCCCFCCCCCSCSADQHVTHAIKSR